MPEPSEIQRPDDLPGTYSHPSPPGPVKEPSHEDKLSFLSIISLAIASDVPLVDLPRMQGVEGTSYGLGAGISSTVSRHKSGSESETICPPGTMVALKKYTASPKEPLEVQRLHRLLWQELQIFCHPFLKTHENICRMLYVRWEIKSVLPVIALEMGTYGRDQRISYLPSADNGNPGTLASALQHIRNYDSPLRKSHLTADIVLGLAAMHECGFCHGDIKTDNVIIKEHPTRTIVAKLADFSGSKSVTTRHDESRPDFGTALWQPPEVLMGSKYVNWQSADMYSLGMVIATLWTTEGLIPEGGTFMDPKIPHELDIDAKSLWLSIIKTRDDASEESLIITGKTVTSCPQSTALPVHSIICHTLSSCPKDRFDVQTLLDKDMKPFLEKFGREVSVLGDIPGGEEYESDETHEIDIGEDDRYMERSSDFRGLVFKTMIEIANMLHTTKLPRLPDLEEGFPNGEVDILAGLEHLNCKHRQLLLESKVPASFHHLAYQIFLSYMYGHGAKLEEPEAAKWLYRAAMAHNSSAMLWYPSVEDSFTIAPRFELPPPRRLWAAVAVGKGIKKSAAYLERTDPVLLAHITPAYRRLYWNRKTAQVCRFQMSWPEIQEWVKSEGVHVDDHLPVRPLENDYHETALHYATAIGDTVFVRYLVTVAGANVNALSRFNESVLYYALMTDRLEITNLLIDHGGDVTQITPSGVSILQSLSLMDDANAVSVLPRIVQKGADACFSDRKPVVAGKDFDQHTLLPGLAINYAAVRQLDCLFDNLLEVHKSQKLDVADICQLLQGLAYLRQSRMLESVLSSLNEIIKPFGGHAEVERPFPSLSANPFNKMTGLQHSHGHILLEGHFLLSLLKMAMDLHNGGWVMHRYRHGSQFLSAKRSTIVILLKFCETSSTPDVPFSSIIRDMLKQSVSTGDLVTLSLCVEVFEQEDTDIIGFFSDPFEFRGCNALGVSIMRDAYNTFLFLLNRYPQLCNGTNRDEGNNLMVAARYESTRYVKALLDHGADRYSRNEGGDNAFLGALVSGPNLDVASLLAEGADLTEMLGCCPVTGLTAFNRLLSLLVKWKRNIDVRALRYLAENYGPPSIIFDPEDGTTVLSYLLMSQTLYTDIEQINLETVVFRYLTERFGKEVLDSVDRLGKAPLHHAAVRARPDAIRILIQRGANVHVLKTAFQVEGSGDKFGGFTPLALAIMISKRGPPSRVKQGSEDIKIWQQRMNEVIRLLSRYGDECGPGANEETRARAKLAAGVESDERTFIVDLTLPRRQLDKRDHAEWPKRIPWEAESMESDEEIEVMGSNGLSHYTAVSGYMEMQLELAKMEVYTHFGLPVNRLREAPEEYLNQLQEEWNRVETGWLNMRGE